MNKVIFIAGGIWQKPFVQYLKDKGHFVAIVNPVVTATTKLADYHIKCDIKNLDEINRHIAELNPIFVTSDQSDVSTGIVSQLSEQWGLPCNSIDVIDKLTNKFSIFKFGKSIGVPVPETEIVRTSDDIKNFATSHGFPIIIKPVDSTMSRGFRKINSESEINEELLESSAKFSKSNTVIVQKFVPGDMVTLEGACSGGKHKTLATSRKTEYFKAGITSGVYYPSNMPTELLDRIIETNDRYVEMAGMEFGLTHSEYLINDDGFCLLEIGARGGGAGITNIITPWVSGINSYDILYESLMGKVIDVKSLSPLKRPAWLKYYRKEDIDEHKSNQIKKLPGVAVFCHNFVGTQFVKDKNDIRYSMGIFLAEDEKEMSCILKGCQ